MVLQDHNSLDMNNFKRTRLNITMNYECSCLFPEEKIVFSGQIAFYDNYNKSLH